MKTKLSAFWIPIAAVAAFALGALLFKGCGDTSPRIVTQYLPVNIDSLKATIPPDTVTMPGKQITRVIRIPVLLSDTKLVDSLREEFEAQHEYYSLLIAQLKGDDKDLGWSWGDPTTEVVLDMNENIYADSVTTPNYFHKWSITAEGAIKAYTYQVVPLCPKYSVPEFKKPKAHRAGLLIGGQFEGGQILPVYGAQYQYKWLNAHAAYIPATTSLQLAAGFTIGIK